ncbi:MAG: MotA/TolQ/ExbB proton channel family protein [Planctomycetales bacterium]
MSSAPSRKSASINPHSEPSDWGAQLLLSPWLWGPALTVGFYQSLPYLPIDQTFLFRYFQSHWTLYCEMGCFFLGMCILIRKGLGLFRESRALRLPLLNAISPELAISADRARRLWEATQSLPVGYRRTKLVTRVREICEYISNRGSVKALEDHLRYLADMASDGLSASYSLVRTITWAIPILGFLGTVIGITMAIANITPEQLESSLTGVTAGLAVAFDTTALALTLSMILVFSTFVVERNENRILSQVEELGISGLAPALADDDVEDTPLARAEVQAAEQLLQRTEELVNWQTGLWKTALEGMRERWLEVAQSQQSQFTRALESGMNATLESHQQQLTEVRGELLGACRTVAQELAQVVEGVQQSATSQQRQFAEQVATLWGRMQQELSQARGEQTAQMRSSAELLAGAVGQWHGDLTRATDAVTSQMETLVRHGEVLRELTAGEAELARLQGTLSDNLQAVRAVEAFEESIHSLNAAVHLLTARARPHAA